MYEHAGIYTYKVKEQAGTDERVDYDDTAFTVTITVEDTEEAKLNVTDITYEADDEEKEEIRFYNTFTFDPKKVRAAGHPCITMMVFTDPQEKAFRFNENVEVKAGQDLVATVL